MSKTSDNVNLDFPAKSADMVVFLPIIEPIVL